MSALDRLADGPRRPLAGLHRTRAAFSLTELLVASAISLVVMAAVGSLFSLFSRALSQGQAAIELAGKMRTTAWRLRQDLAGVTVRMRPPARPESNSGYFELVEGPLRDSSAAANSANLSADTDDILLFTTKSAGGPFVGRYGANELIESDTAEVAWFCREASADLQPAALPSGMKVFNLYRRQLLVVGYVGKSPFFEAGNRLGGMAINAAQQMYDISLRPEENWLVPNTLSDLTDRKNRFGRGITPTPPFPYALALQADQMPMQFTFDETTRVWEDVMLTNIIAFDVRVYDPGATAQVTGDIVLFPGDAGYAGGTGAYGAYVDLGGGQGSTLGQAVNTKSQVTTRTYDTWTTGYEFDGLDTDNNGIIDDGFNGKDDNNNGLIDEATEFETSPPYPVPLRGIEVRIRCYEPVSKQVRQITIRQAFNH